MDNGYTTIIFGFTMNFCTYMYLNGSHGWFIGSQVFEWATLLQLFLGSQVFFIRMKNWWCQRCPHTIASSTWGPHVRVGDMSPESVCVSVRAHYQSWGVRLYVCNQSAYAGYCADAIDRLLISKGLCNLPRSKWQHQHAKFPHVNSI